MAAFSMVKPQAEEATPNALMRFIIERYETSVVFVSELEGELAN